MKLNNYDKIANYYDTLSRLVFFKSQVNAQINQLSYLPKDSSILIVGGGTGWILEEIAKFHSSGLFIVYVEISEKMITLSKNRKWESNKLEFVNVGIEDFTATTTFDVILTPFLFDNFSIERSELVFQKLHNLLKKNGFWFLVDFYQEKNKESYWSSFLLKSMYSFFKMLHIVEANSLIDMEPYFIKNKYQKLEEKFYYASFIKAVVFKKISD